MKTFIHDIPKPDDQWWEIELLEPNGAAWVEYGQSSVVTLT